MVLKKSKTESPSVSALGTQEENKANRQDTGHEDQNHSRGGRSNETYEEVEDLKSESRFQPKPMMNNF